MDGGKASAELGPHTVRGNPGARRLRRTGTSLGRHMTLTVLALLTMAPILLLISTALKTRLDAAGNPFGLFTTFSLQNFDLAWNEGHFGEYMLNSVRLAVPSTVLVVALSTLGGYAFARLPYRGRSIVFYLVALGFLVPFFAYMIPLYYQLRSLGLLNSLTGVILVIASTNVSFGTFFMRAFFVSLPVELEQAARVDGASEFQIFYKVMVPLALPGMVALTTFIFLQAWNSFVIPLLYVPGGGLQPLTVGLYQFSTGRVTDLGPLAAATLITIVPVLAVFVGLQRQVTEGFISGAVKG